MADRDLEGLFAAYGRELESYLTRQVRCPHTAADLAQETFLRLAQQPPGAGDDNARAYLFRTARNLAIDHFRMQRRRRTDAVPAERLAHHADDAPRAEEIADARQRLGRLGRAIAELPPLTREIFRLNRVEGRTYAQVAADLGVSESSVQKHLARALRHAMQSMRED